MYNTKELDEYCKQYYKPIEAAYLVGFRAAAQDAVDTLEDYATATAGIKDTVNVSLGYTNAAHSLQVYFTKILDKAENELS